MRSILVGEPLSAGDPASTEALGRGSAANLEMMAAGEAMRNAIVADLAAIEGTRVTVAVREQEARHADWPDRVRTVALLPGEDLVEFMRRQAPLHDASWVVAPESDGLLLRLHEAVGAHRWIGCNAASIRLAGSKSATCQALQRNGIATPLALAATHRGAWIVKPDDGAGSMDTRWHATRAGAEADLRRREQAGQRAVVQAFVEGDPLSISLIVGPDLARPLAFNRQRLARDGDGRLHDLGVQVAAVAPGDPRVPALRAVALQVAAAIPGLCGHVGVDLVWKEREGPVVIEVNPRVTCAYVGLSAVLGRNVAAEILAAHARRATHKVAPRVPA